MHDTPPSSAAPATPPSPTGNRHLDSALHRIAHENGQWVAENGDVHRIEAIEAPDCRAPAHAPTPGLCNTGVIIESQGALQGGRDAGATPTRGTFTPNDYFGSLRLDTLKLSAEVATESAERVGLEWIEKKRKAADDTDSAPRVTAHDGTQLKVKAHGPNDNRSVLMVGSGIEVTAVPSGNTPVPFLAIEFGAAPCWNHSVDELTQWAQDFADYFGLWLDRTLVSRMDACTDVDERFYRSDVDRFEGQHRGGLTGTVAFENDANRFTGLRYERSSHRPLTFRVYDKRAEVDTRDGHTFWEKVWDRHGVNEDTPIWRVEFEARRGRLKERGIRSWGDLNQSNLERFWTYCTTKFARMDRQVWDKVQDASTQDAADRAETEDHFDPEGLHRQADGCMDSAARKGDTSKAEELARLIDRQDDATKEELRDLLNG